jgi:hypothetical protein
MRFPAPHRNIGPEMAQRLKRLANGLGTMISLQLALLHQWERFNKNDDTVDPCLRRAR